MFFFFFSVVNLPNYYVVQNDIIINIGEVVAGFNFFLDAYSVKQL